MFSFAEEASILLSAELIKPVNIVDDVPLWSCEAVDSTFEELEPLDVSCEVGVAIAISVDSGRV